MNAALKKFLPLFALVLALGTVWFSGILENFNLQFIQQHREALLVHVHTHPALSGGVFMLVYAIAVALSLPIATLITLLGGALFGLVWGTLVVVIGATVGAAILFLIARSAVGESLRQKAGPLYQKVADNMAENAVGYMLFMRLVPLFPFFLVNIVPALFNVRLLPYVLTTAIGILPGTVIYVNFGRELGSIQSLSDLASPQMLLAFALLGAFALVPMLYQKIKAKKAAQKILLALVVLSGVGVAPMAYGVEQQPYQQFSENYGALLAAHTAPTRAQQVRFIGVNYQAWGADSRHQKALEQLQKIEPRQFEAMEQKMAFWINTYNFLTIALIVKEKEETSIRNLGTLFQNPWKRFSWQIGSKTYTLDQIEHAILRPMGDARIHFAINCASISCPDLLNAPYKADILNQQLDTQTRLALQQADKTMHIDGTTLHLNKIFDWFEQDFNQGDVRTWLQAYAPDVAQTNKIKYMPYQWALNKTL